MAKKMKKFMSMALVLCMMASMLSVGAFAAEEVTTEAVEGGTIVTTTTTNTDENGNTTVTVKIEENTSKTDSDGKNVTFNEVYEETTVTNSDGDEVSSNWEVNGKETSEWTEEDSGDAAGQPQVDVSLVPGETTTGTAGVTSETVTNADGSVTTTTTTDRTVTADTSEMDVTINETAAELESVTPDRTTHLGLTSSKDKVYISLNTSKTDDYADISVDFVTGEAPEGGEYQYMGIYEKSAVWASQIVIYFEKDEQGNTVYDENGEPVIEKMTHRNGNVLLDPETLEPSTDLNGLWKFYDSASGTYKFAQTGTRANIFLLKNADGDAVYGYCCDVQTPVENNAWYDVANLEDSDYYASEESVEHIRAIVENGYWGTSNKANDDGEYETGSVEKMKQSIKNAIANGEIEDEFEISYYPGNDGTGENTGSELVTVKVKLSEVIDGLTAGEALTVTQAAIWSYANGYQDAMTGVDGNIFGSLLYSSVGRGNTLGPESAARMRGIFDWLMNLESEEESSIVINEKNSVEDVSLTIGDKAEGFAANADNDKDNDVYNTELNFKLAFIPGENDDLLVHISYTDLDGNVVNVVKRLAGTNAEGQSYEDIKPEADGSYVLKGLKLSENKDFDFDLRLEGTQYLEHGVYIYSPVGGRDASQTFVGLAEGNRTVDVSVGMTISFDVDENNHVVAERTWHDDGDPVNEFPGVFALAVHRPLENIPEEEVPLADAPQTGDEAIVFAALTLLAGISLMAMHVSEQKRKEEV